MAPVSLLTFGLIIGMPRFKPRTTNNIPTIPIITGMVLRILLIAERLIIFPIIDTANISGIVPNPKKNINEAPLNASPVANAAVRAIYTRPQGSRPFNNPSVNKEENDFLLISFPSIDFSFPTDL
jgi:hypothetical protein